MKKTLFLLFSVMAAGLITCREIDTIFPNQPPVASAGENMSIPSGQSVFLDGSGSTDPDGDSLSYTWTIISKPAQSLAEIVDFDSVTASIVPDVTGTFEILLLVSDNIETDADTLVIDALKGNSPPVVNAGNNNAVDLGTQYALNGSATDPDQDPLTINWTLQSKPAGSAATIQNPTNLNALIVIDKHGTYTARLQVTDGTFVVNDDVTITTNPVSVTSINPTSGPRGITVKIAGKNFSATPSENQVTFNGMAATVSAASYTSLDAVVPTGAGTGPVAVRVNSITSTGPVFTYLLSPVVSTVAQFNRPIYMAVDGSGNIYISDYNSNVIRRLTTSGQLTTIAGNGQAGYGDGKLLEAQFNRPAGIAIDQDNNIYVADNNNHCIRRISLDNGVVTTFAGFPQAGYNDAIGGQAQFSAPIGLAIDNAGNLYVGDNGNSRIRRITPGAVVSTMAGNGQTGFADGVGQAAVFNGIAGIAVSPNNIVYVADALNHRIRRIDQQGVVTTLAGNGTPAFVNGTGTAARFSIPYGIGCDANGVLYVADLNNHSIRRVTPQGAVTTLVGDGTAGFVEGSNARFNQPTGVLVHPNGNIYVADYNNNRVRLITFE